MNKLQDLILNQRFTKLAKTGPLLAGFMLRGLGSGANQLGYQKALREHGKALADRGIDPEDLPGKEGGSWVGAPMIGGALGGGLGYGLGSYLDGDNPEGSYRDTLMAAGIIAGGLPGLYKVYNDPSRVAKDLLEGKKTKETELMEIRDYIHDTLKENEGKAKSTEKTSSAFRDISLLRRLSGLEHRLARVADTQNRLTPMRRGISKTTDTATTANDARNEVESWDSNRTDSPDRRAILRYLSQRG